MTMATLTKIHQRRPNRPVSLLEVPIKLHRSSEFSDEVGLGTPSDAAVTKARGTDPPRVEDVATVDYQLPRQPSGELRRVDRLEFRPLRQYDQNVSFRGRESARGYGDRRKLWMIAGREAWLVCGDHAPSCDKISNDAGAQRVAQATRPSLEGHSPDPDTRAVEIAQLLLRDLDDPACLSFVDLEGRAKELVAAPDRVRQRVHALEILLEARSAESDPRGEKLLADAPVGAHPVEYCQRVGSDRVAQVGDLVRVADLEREVCIR